MTASRSAAQQAASRANGARSHGPTTAAGEDREAFAELHAAVSSDWGPRDAYEQHWVMELVTSLWRQDRLRGLELATLSAAEESPPSEATVRKLDTYARYGARIDRDLGRALQALRVLRDRPDAWIEEERERTSEPQRPGPQEQKYTNELTARTFEPEPANGNVEPCTDEPEPPALNRHQRRRLAALARRRRAA
jgi:hypothetical protein